LKTTQTWRVSRGTRNSDAIQEYFRLFIVIVDMMHKEANGEKVGQIKGDLMKIGRMSLQGFPEASDGLI
jgi:hypothetical protein